MRIFGENLSSAGNITFVFSRWYNSHSQLVACVLYESLYCGKFFVDD